jgi:hypothetical protein
MKRKTRRNSSAKSSNSNQEGTLSQAEARDWLNKLEARFEEVEAQRLRARHNRTQIHLADLRDPERVDELAQRFSSAESFALFRELAAVYERDPSLENYLQLRLRIPNVDIDVALFGGIEALFSLEQHLRKHAIDPGLVASTLDAFEPAIDVLSLHIMTSLVAKQKLPTSGPGHIQKRRNAISNTLVNYLIAIMLEAIEWNKSEIVIPSSLILLIRHQLCGSSPDLHKEFLAWETRGNAATTAALNSKGNKRISVRKLAKLVGVSAAIAGRWLADPEFQDLVEHDKMMLAKEGSEKPQKSNKTPESRGRKGRSRKQSAVRSIGAPIAVSPKSTCGTPTT